MIFVWTGLAIGAAVLAFLWHQRQMRRLRAQLEMLVDERTGQLFVEKERATVALRDSEALRAAAEEANTRATSARETALQASAAKTTFVASITHEIRTPLNAIVAMTDLLAETPLDDAQRRHVATLKAAGAALSELINHTLDMSRIEVGRFEIAPAPFDLRALLDETAAMSRLRAAQKGLVLETVIDPATPSNVYGDAVALRRVLINLLGNAVKFTDRGTVTLRVMPAVAGATSPVLFSVDDTGIGIAPQKLDVIFDSYAQADESINKKFGGAGLGLSISRELVELMGGRIWVRSQVGHGSTFSFTVPLSEASAVPRPAPPQIPESPARPLRILLAEDSPLNRLVVTAHLEKTSDVIDVAEDGRAAVDSVRTRRYDLVLMDVNMPEMDGYAAAAAIRRWEQETRQPRTPIVALTAHAFAEDVERSRLAGCDEHVTKPVKRQTLLDLLDRYRAARPLGEDVETA
jgi:signal transduction histidine kinase/AmiR/NasT family two-component response regulator